MLENRLREIIEVNGITKEELAERSDLSVETIRNIYYGKTPDPKVSTVMKIAKALNMTVNCLMGDCSHSMEERVLLQYFRGCGNHGKKILMRLAQYEAMIAKEERKNASKYKISCLVPYGEVHQGIEYDKCGVIDVMTTNKEAYMAIKMANNDFVPMYCKDDIVLVANRFPSPNEYGVFFQNKRAFIRQYIEEDNQYRLRCIHNYNKDMVFKRMDEIEYIGTCCGVVRA